MLRLLDEEVKWENTEAPWMGRQEGEEPGLGLDLESPAIFVFIFLCFLFKFVTCVFGK